MMFRKSEVAFDAAAHEYSLRGKRLEGYTSTIGQWMYPHTYDGVPEATLAAAAARGTAIHGAVRVACVSGEPTGFPEAEEGARLLAAAGLAVAEWEWLVDDGASFASAIDALCQDGTVIDIKTTSELHVPEVTLQLSVYAHWLELMNPGLTVPSLRALWLPRERYGKCRLVDIDRIPAGTVAALIAAYQAGEDSAEYLRIVSPAPDLPAEWGRRVAAWYELQESIAELQEREKNAREWLFNAFEKMGVKKYEDPFVRITRVDPTTRSTVDGARLKKEYPEIYADCLKTSEVKGSVRITMR